MVKSKQRVYDYVYSILGFLLFDFIYCKDPQFDVDRRPSKNSIEFRFKQEKLE